MSLRKFHRHRIFNLAIREDAMQESISKSLDRTLDARTFNHINADTDHTHKGFGSADGRNAQKRCDDASHSKALGAKPEADSLVFPKLWERGASSRRFFVSAFIHRNLP